MTRFYRPCLLAVAALSLRCTSRPADDDGVDALDPTRVAVVNAPLHIGGTQMGGLAPRTFTSEGGGSFVHVATVAAPVSSGERVQATNFAFDGNYAYVVYNMAGEEVLGALDVLDLSDVDAPRLVSTKVFRSFEFADVQVRGSYVFAVGARTDVGATMQVFDIGNKAAPRAVGSLDFDAFYATSITIEANTAWVTTGTDGGLVGVDIADPGKPRIVIDEPLPNALSMIAMDGAHLVLGGDPTLAVHREKSGALLQANAVFAGHVEAPGRLALRDHRLFANAGHTGLTMMSVSADGITVTTTGWAPLEGTGNGIDASSTVLFLAQGDAGVHLYEFHGNDAPAPVGRFDFSDDRGSANQVRYGKACGRSYVFVGDGLGGFRIVRFDE